VEVLITILREVRDPRDFNARHDCASMLFIALIATLCGAKSCVGYADFAAAHVEELAEVVDLPYGAPSHDSFSRLFGLLDPAELEKSLRNFAQTLREGLGLGPVKGLIAFDGKRLRRGYERGRACMPPLMVSVWDAETRISIAARASSDGNEVAATLQALKSLDLKGCWVAADALHCHPEMAAETRAAGGHYALKLKGTTVLCLLARSAPSRWPIRPANAPFTKLRRKGTIGSSAAAPVLSRRLRTRRAFRGWPHSGASKASGALERRRVRSSLIISRCPNACRPKL